jgi:hypothetical protein
MDAPGEMEQARGDQPPTCRLPPLPWRGPASARGSTTMQGWSQLAKVWWVCQGMARWPREHGNWRCTPPVGRNVWPVRHCSDFTFISFPFCLSWIDSASSALRLVLNPKTEEDGRGRGMDSSRWTATPTAKKYVDKATKKEVKDIFRPLWPHPPRRRPQALRAQEVWWARRYQKSCRNC